MYCKADFKSIAKCKKWLCAAVFSLFLKNMRRAANLVLQSRCKAILAPPQSTPKNTKTGRKSVGFLILTQAPKCTRSHCFPPQKHPKNGFVMRFAGKNSFLQVRSAHVLILSALSQQRDASYQHADPSAAKVVSRSHRCILPSLCGSAPYTALYHRRFFSPRKEVFQKSRKKRPPERPFRRPFCIGARKNTLSRPRPALPAPFWQPASHHRAARTAS